MTGLLVLLGVLTATAGAARSTYSPCGLSMLSSITPFGERSRRHRYCATASWFVAGAVAGGITLGAVASGLAAVAAVIAPPRDVIAAAGAGLALLTVAIDGGCFGEALPVVRRQVDDSWLAKYRPWLYGAGFGWQIGVGFATYVMTASVALILVLAALSTSPIGALVVGISFGLARGLTVFLTARSDSPAGLRVLHARLDSFGPAVRWGVVGVESGVVVVLLVAATGAVPPLWLGGLMVGAAGALGALTARRRVAVHA
ncbi:MAG: hypothetical protein JO337_11085 [Acidimicrobiales bacterium]|nr:hypothetical protein [Acidimicrobiales bacterium]